MTRDRLLSSVSFLPRQFFLRDMKHWLLAWLLFFLLAFLFRGLELPASDSVVAVLPTALFFSVLYIALYALLMFGGVWRLSLLWLGVPYFIFALAWLRWYWALPCALVWFIALQQTACMETRQKLVPDYAHLVAILMVTVWVYLSGAGNHGNQSPDYAIHNGRLLDLVQFPWPLHYTDGLLVQNPAFGPRYTYFVGYSGFFLPAALLGKLAGYGAAQECLHLWALFGCWLALVWLWELTRGRLVIAAALLLMLFGGLDVAGAVLTVARHPAVTSLTTFTDHFYRFWQTLPEDTGNLDFWPVGHMGFFFGNYLSNASQLYWSPHQTIAAWVAGGLLARAFLEKRVACVAFLFSLLAYWSPMNMMTVALFPLVLVLGGGVARFRQSISFANVAGGGSILLVFALYYFSGSAGVNPFSWLWNSSAVEHLVWVMIFFHFFSWVLYAVLVLPGVMDSTGNARLFFAALCVSLLLLSFVSYGTYNDLLCRGSAILMFFMMVMVLRRLEEIQHAHRRGALAVLSLVLVLGSWSSLQHVYRSVVHFDEQKDPQSIINSIHGWEYLGPVDSFFVRHLSREPAVMPVSVLKREGEQQ